MFKIILKIKRNIQAVEKNKRGRGCTRQRLDYSSARAFWSNDATCYSACLSLRQFFAREPRDTYCLSAHHVVARIRGVPSAEKYSGLIRMEHVVELAGENRSVRTASHDVSLGYHKSCNEIEPGRQRNIRGTHD